MAARRLVVGTAGNVSARIEGGFVITPTRAPYDTMREDDLVVVGLDGHPPPGASTETPLHRAAYALREDIGGIVHTHSPYATAWGITGEPLVETEDLRYYGLGTPQTVPRLPAGSAQLAEACRAALAQSDIVLLAGHGVLAVGADPAAALLAAEVVERQAEISWLARAIMDGHHLARGTLRDLPRP
jgi:L-fuculose-phosphate aldolase